MIRFKELKEVMDKLLNEDRENTELNQILKTIQDLKVGFYKEMEALRKLQTEIKLKMEEKCH